MMKVDLIHGILKVHTTRSVFPIPLALLLDLPPSILTNYLHHCQVEELNHGFDKRHPKTNHGFYIRA